MRLRADRKWIVACVVSLLALVMALLTSCVGHLGQVPSRVQYSEVQRHAAVEIFVDCIDEGGDLKSWSGSGVIVDKRAIITVHHVAYCPGVSNIMAIMVDNGVFVAQMVWGDAEADVARLEVEEDLPDYWRGMRLGPLPKEGDTICIQAAVPVASRKCGDVAVVSASTSGPDIYHFAHTIPGNSGSGVYDMHGRLIALAATYRPCVGPDGKWHVCGGSVTSLWRHRHSLGLNR